MIAVRAQATPEPSTRASHARVPTLTPRPDRPAAQDDRPYGLAHAAPARPGPASLANLARRRERTPLINWSAAGYRPSPERQEDAREDQNRFSDRDAAGAHTAADARGDRGGHGARGRRGVRRRRQRRQRRRRWRRWRQADHAEGRRDPDRRRGPPLRRHQAGLLQGG